MTTMPTHHRNWIAPALAALLIGAILAANAATNRYGVIPAGFGLTVTAGTYTAGACLSLRDALHELAGIRWVLAAILAGAAASLAVARPTIAVASGVAFLIAELLDLAVYTPLRRAGWRRAVIASNIVGAFADSLIFLSLAGYRLTGEAVGGQLLVKAVWVTGLYLLIAEGVRRALLRYSVRPARA